MIRLSNIVRVSALWSVVVLPLAIIVGGMS
jgi:hypothetical protein